MVSIDLTQAHEASKGDADQPDGPAADDPDRERARQFPRGRDEVEANERIEFEQQFVVHDRPPVQEQPRA